MTTPTIFSNFAANPKSQPDPFDAGGGSQWSLATASIPAATAAGVNVALVRIYPGFRLNEFFIYNDDLDTGTTVTSSVGWLYDTPTAAAVEDPDGLLVTGNALRTANNLIAWPADSTRGAAVGNFVAQAWGYLIIQVVAGPTTTLGNVYFKYTADYIGL